MGTWTIQRIYGENFLSFPSFEVTCGDRGVVLVTGLNGAGKSTITAEALCWCLFGELLRNRSLRRPTSDDVILDPDRTGKGKGCLVGVELVDEDGNALRVERGRKHKVLKNLVRYTVGEGEPQIGPPKTLDPLILQTLGTDWETFLTTSIFGQGQVARFSSGTDATRKAILDELLGTARFAQARQVAADFAKDLREQLTELDWQVKQAEQTTTGLQTELDLARSRVQQWSIGRDADVQALTGGLDETQERLAHAQRSLPDLEGLRQKREALRVTVQAEDDRLRAAALAAVAVRRDAADVEQAARLAYQDAQAATVRDQEGARAGQLRQLQDLQAEIRREQAADTALAGRLGTLELDDRHDQSQIRRFNDDLASLAAQIRERETYRESLFAPDANRCPTCHVDLAAAEAHELLHHDVVAGFTAVLEQQRAAATLQLDRLCTAQATSGEQLRRTQNQIVARDGQRDELKQQRVDQLAKLAQLESQRLARNAAVPVSSVPAPVSDAALTVAREAGAAARLAVDQADAARQAFNASDPVQAITALTLQVAQAEPAYRRWEQEIARLTEEVGRVRGLLAHRRAEENPHVGQIASLVVRVTESTATEAAQRLARDQTTANLADLEFWIAGFGPAGIRSLLIRDVVPELNAFASRYAQAISGGAMTVTFSAQTEIASGETRERFEATVELVKGAGTYAGCSGGWRARGDLVQLLALRAMAARRRAGLHVLCFDEAFEALDREGREAAVELLQTVAADLGGTLFLITHSDEFQACFPQQIRVVRDAGGRSRIAGGEA